MALSTGGISYGASIGLSFRTDDGDLVSRLLKASRSLEGAALTAVQFGAVDDAQDCNGMADGSCKLTFMVCAPFFVSFSFFFLSLSRLSL